MDDEQVDKLCDALSPIYCFFDLLDHIEKEKDFSRKLELIKTSRNIREICKITLPRIKEIIYE